MQYGICLLAFMFIGAYLYTLFTCSSCPPFTSFQESLKPNQLALYHIVVRQRLEKSIQGLVLGTILAFLYLYIFKGTWNPVACGCGFATVILLTQYLYYILSPKLSMLPHLDDQRQVEQWYSVYKFMQYRYHLGMALGAVGYFLFVFSLLK